MIELKHLFENLETLAEQVLALAEQVQENRKAIIELQAFKKSIEHKQAAQSPLGPIE